MTVKVEYSGWRALSRRARGVLVAVGVGAGSLTLGGVMALSTGVIGASAALPLCGGNQTLHPAPLTCTNSRLIDGTTFTVVLDVNASGVAVVTYTLDAPRPADTPIRVRWHEGLSNGPIISEISGVIPAGSTGPVALSVSASTCGGQIDIKAVFTANGDTRGRVGAPKVSTPNCTTTSTSTTTPRNVTTTTPTTTATTITSPSTTGATTTPSSVAQATVTTHPPLPATGSGDLSPAVVGGLALGLGAALVVVTRRRLFDNEPS